MKSPRGIWLFNVYSFLSSLDFYLPIKIVYFHQLLGSYATASSIISFVWISQALMEVPTGIFSDLIGRKKTIIVGSFCSVLGYLLYASGSEVWVLMAGSFLIGSSKSFFSGNNNAYLHNLLSAEHAESRYHQYYGKLNSVIGIAMLPAALFSGVLLGWSIDKFMWINLVPQVTGLVIAFFLTDIKSEEKVNTNIFRHLNEAFKEITGNLKLRYLSLSQILGGGGLAAYEFQAAVYAMVWPTWAIGIARAVQEGGVIPSFYFAGKIIDKLGVARVLVVSWFTSVLGNVLAAVSQSVISPLFVMMSLPLYGAGDTANQKVLQAEFTEKQRATIASLNSLGNSITFSVVLYICGLIANSYGPFIALLATQISLIPSFYFELKFIQKLRNIS